MIAHCRFGVFARTHAAIAAYSSGIPCVTIGYSVKAQGIGNDMGMGDYVIPLNELESDSKITNSVIAMIENENDLRGKLIEKNRDIPHNLKKMQQEILSYVK